MPASLPASANPLLQDLKERSAFERFGWKDGVMTRLLGDRLHGQRSFALTSVSDFLSSPDASPMADGADTALRFGDDALEQLVGDSVLEPLPIGLPARSEPDGEAP